MGSKDFKIILDEYEGSDKAEERAEELGVEFPLYMQCYREALGAVLSNIAYNKEANEKRRGQKSAFIGAKEAYTPPLDGSNIVAFIGDRGTGKTTAVNGFCKILHDYHQKREKWETEIVYKGNERKEYRFQVMAPIDASVLGTKEDLIEVILASMYQAFQERKDDREREVLKQRIVREFNEVYMDYININVGMREDQRILGESVLVKLRNISSSLKTKAVFGKLIDDFLKWLDEDRADDSYLVVTIDDLDMHQESGFEMLEQLHKYMESSKIIILVAIRYEQMKLLCDKYFLNCIMPTGGNNHKSVYLKFEKNAKKLSSDYLLKVLPLSNRIYMPEKKLLYKRGMIKEDQEVWIFKQYIFRKIALKMNIFYDIKGLKKHFCLPETVRELIAYRDFLNSLFSMEEIEAADVVGTEKQMSLYDQNHERFNWDIEKRMAVQLLSDDQLKVFQLIVERNLERRAQYAVSFLKSRQENVKQKKDDKQEKNKEQEKEKQENNNGYLMDNVDEQHYCYTDLMEIIYKLGRSNYEDKVLIHCILASFTSEMEREYYSYRNNSDEVACRRSENRLKCFIGETFGGEWFGKVMPEVTIPSAERRLRTSIGYIQTAEISKVEIVRRLTTEYGVEGVIERFTEVVPYIECLTTLFSNFVDESGKATSPRWVFELEDELFGEVRLTIKSEASVASFDIFGFIGKEMVSDDGMGFQSLYDELMEGIESGWKQYLQKTDYRYADRINILDLRKKMKEKSIWVKERKRNTGKGKAVFPYYNLDLSYNVMKRVRGRIKRNTLLGGKDLYEYFSTIYSYIAEELKEEENEYRKFMETDKVPSFYEDFMESSFVQMFDIKVDGKSTKRKKTDKNVFIDIFGQVFRSIILMVPKEIDEQNITE